MRPRVLTTAIAILTTAVFFATPRVSRAQPAYETRLSGLPAIAVYAYGAKDLAFKRAVAARLVVAFANSGHYRALEEHREFFEYAAAGYGNSAAPISTAQYAQMGRQFGADYICVAEVSVFLGEERIFAHIVDVKTAKITALGAGDTPLRIPADFTAASDDVVAAMLKPAPQADAPTVTVPATSVTASAVPVATAPAATAPPSAPVAAAQEYAPPQTRYTEETRAVRTVTYDEAPDEVRFRKTKYGFSLAYGYDPDITVFQVGFAVARPVMRERVTVALETNVLWAWGDRHKSGDNNGAVNDKSNYYGVNIPLLCQLDVSVFNIEAGMQADAVFNDYGDKALYNAGLVAGAGVSFRSRRVYYRYSRGTAYYSHTVGVRALF
jgi:hypothetical protein